MAQVIEVYIAAIPGILTDKPWISAYYTTLVYADMNAQFYKMCVYAYIALIRFYNNSNNNICRKRRRRQ